MFKRVVILAVCLSVGTAFCIDAQKLNGKSRLGLSFGHSTSASDEIVVDGSGVDLTTAASGMVTSIDYSRWVQEDLALGLSVRVHAIDVGVSASWLGVDDHFATVTPIFVGASYYPAGARNKSSVRPFLSAQAGPIIGHESRVYAGLGTQVRARSESAFGGRVGAGLDFRVSRLLMLGILGGYTMMSDFREPIGGSLNINGGDVGISIGFIL